MDARRRQARETIDHPKWGPYVSRRISYDEYLAAVALSLARTHTPGWNHILKRVTCRCGRDLPCEGRRPIPISRENWPA
ncbi:hypothetical protein GCM10012279_23710 [Micromonospora yangpuensis]|nr:hypothetical protein GCM10012279_23710 [Micromonospora yangpuensis]